MIIIGCDFVACFEVVFWAIGKDSRPQKIYALKR